jgi:hypothetical protein
MVRAVPREAQRKRAHDDRDAESYSKWWFHARHYRTKTGGEAMKSGDRAVSAALSVVILVIVAMTVAGEIPGLAEWFTSLLSTLTKNLTEAVSAGVGRSIYAPVAGVGQAIADGANNVWLSYQEQGSDQLAPYLDPALNPDNSAPLMVGPNGTLLPLPGSYDYYINTPSPNGGA